MIAPASFHPVANRHPQILEFRAEQFARVGDEPEGMGYLSLRLNQVADLPAEVKAAWQHAIRHELDRGLAAPQRQRHRPVVLRAAVDQATRDRVLGRAFSI